MHSALNLLVIAINLSLLAAQHATTKLQLTTHPPTTIPPVGPDLSKKPEKRLAGDEFNTRLTDWLFTGCWSDQGKPPLLSKCAPFRPAEEYPGYDGWYNNVAKTELGAVDTHLLRKVPATYEDGVYKPSGSNRPNPLELSDRLLSGDIGTKSRTGRNALLVFFGQQVVEEILDAQRPACPPEYFNIDIPENHTYNLYPGHTKMPVLRTRYDQRTGHSPNNPRQQLNEITPYLDGGLIYGTSKAWSDVLRTYANGTVHPAGELASSPSGSYPEYNSVRLPMANPPPPAHHQLYVSRHYTEKVSRYFKLGNPRGNENPFLLTFGVVWFRWHNFLAKHIKRHNPTWSSDKIYNEARKWVIATQQRIVVDEWLPSWLGKSLSKYKGYNPNIDPQIDQFFQSAAFRFGHTLVPPGVYLRNYGRVDCSLAPFPIRTCNNYWMSQNSLFANKTKIPINVDKLLMGMAIQLCEEEDHKIVEDLRGSLFGPLEFSRRDLMALNIQRGRDHGVPDYNSARRAYGLHTVNNISHFPARLPQKIKDNFLDLYNNSFDNVDIWVGGILETGDGPGELFQAIISDQFQRIRDGDRFWYKNLDNGLFTLNEIKRIDQLSIYDLLMCVTDMEWNDIPKNPFRVPTSEGEMHPNCKRNNVIKAGTCVTPCFHADQINASIVENCTRPGTYDYFSKSSASYILTFLGMTTFFCGIVAIIFYKIQFKEKGPRTEKSSREVNHFDNVDSIFTAREWQEPKSSLRHVLITPNVRSQQLEVKNQLGHLIRAVEFPSNSNVMIYCATDNHYILIRVHHSYDLVLKFDSEYLRSAFMKAFDRFMSEIATVGNVCSVQTTNVTLAMLLKQAITKKHRQKKLEMFFRVVFSQAFHIAHREEEILQIDSTVAREVIYTELTMIEFAEALSMRPDAEFVKKIFNLVDKDRNGFISFREFVDMLVIFLKGSAEEKIKLMFDMYDINGTGRLKREEFLNMLRSFMETVNADVTDDELETLVQSMMYHADMADKETINLQDFQQILSDFNDKFNYAELEFNVQTDGRNRKLHAGVHTVRSTFIGEVQRTVESLYADPSELQSRIEGKVENEQDLTEERNNSEIIDKDEKIVEEMKKYSDDYWYPIMKYLANKRMQIFWACLYTLLLLGIFAERIYYYYIEREHSGLRRILGYGLTVTRGAASAMMFTYSTLLLMMCHNTITFLRTTVLQFYIPFDSAIDMHKYIACWALAFTVLHIIGHGFNFYHISTQTADDLSCLFRNYFHATHELPKFHYWCWGTMTGITGILITIVTGLIFICSLPMVRKAFYHWFSFIHSLYPVFYILMVLHGSGRLVQEPYFHYFFLGPAILFILDKVVTVTRTTIEIPILKADILPSGVTCLIFPKPLNFQYKSGQWIRVACPALQTNEFHPFTLSSAPHETSLSIHIRAVGPWTTNIRDKLELCTMSNENLPVIHIDGPYGEGHQDWDKYEVAIMVGGGIGVTPFASILKDVVFRSNHSVNFSCKKVYFLWVTRTQKQFEWLVDILRELEKTDVKNIVSIHIFVTQFYQKFDLRTILLYICERHFQKISNKSLFTGLKAVTHFGRPKFSQFFLSIQKLYSDANKIGVFSCGTPTMTQAVDAACKTINLMEINDTVFQHIYKSF
ncbi:PREDICTED: dual oxidase 2-like isoform X2 [Dinoponera quadriceps]|uniref:NAD(P)H oxidase (H2O2-forming) n=1 Tax=Dinoponera quadriceps TaxID=609295 RepID=A0A6P3XFS4_DINQU|nr:PREDICTED: dual oxidase 2-like isoform X2 [Dinoponera quadriceps]